MQRAGEFAASARPGVQLVAGVPHSARVAQARADAPATLPGWHGLH